MSMFSRCLLPILTLALAVPFARADENASFCQNGTGLPASRPHLKPAADDTNSGSAFTGSRQITAAVPDRKMQLALCRGELRVIHSDTTATTRVEIHLRKPLPAGHTVADYIERFDAANGSLHLAIDLPEENGVSVTLSLPEAQQSSLAIGVGKALLEQMPGDLQIAIGKGDVSLRAAPGDIGEVEFPAALGRLNDTRSDGFGSHGHVLTAWSGKAHGKYRINFAAGSGDLILLTPSTR